MATELGQAFVQIVPSARGIGSAISKELMPESESAGKKAGLGIASMMKKVILAAGIGKAISAAISEGANLQQSLGGVETLFKSNADKVKKYAAEAYKTAGLSANAYMENVTSFSASLLQSLGGNTAKAAEVANMAMIDMADNSNKMGTSMEAIQVAYQGFAKQNYTMLDNLKLGYGGTKTEMQRLLSDATKLTGVKYDINNLADVYDAIHAVQKEIGITGTTAKEANETVSGSFASMKSAFQNLLGTMALGGNVQDSMKQLVDTAVIYLGNLIPMVGNVLSGLPQAFMTAISSAAPFVKEAITSLLTKAFGPEVAGVFNQMTSTLHQALTSMFGNLKQASGQVMSNLQPVFNALKNAFGQLPGLFQTVVSSVQPIFNTIVDGLTRLDFSGFASLANAIIPAISNAFQTFIGIVSPSIDGLVNAFTGLWNAIQPVLSLLADALMPIFQVIASYVGGVVSGAMQRLSGMFNLLRGAIDFLMPVFKFLISVFKSITPILSNIAKSIGTVIGWFSGLGNAGNVLGKGLKGAWEGIGNVITSIKNIINGAIQFIKGLFGGLKSAGSVLQGGISFAWNGIGSAINGAKNIISGAINGIKGFFSGLQTAGNFLKNGLSGAWQGMQGVISSVSGSIRGIVDGIKDRFNGLKNINLQSAGSAIMGGFKRGLESAYQGVKNFVGGIAGWIKSHKGPLTYDKKLLIPAGKAIMEGLGSGLKEQFGSVQGFVSGVGRSISDGLSVTGSVVKVERSLSAMDLRTMEASGRINQMKDKQPINLVFSINGHEFKKLVEDITDVQDKEVELKLSY